MTGFSADWLRLRESADLRARNSEIASAVSGWFALRDAVHVTDIGCGTGANLRAVAPMMPSKQHWRLIDHDAQLLISARAALTQWAGNAHEDENGILHVTKGQAEIAVSFEVRDLATTALEDLTTGAHLVTASAFFDLASAAFIRKIARACSTHRAGFYAALTYNGLQRWAPHRPADSQITAAFNRHQMSDKGFGPAAGPEAASLLADQFRLEGYSVLEGESPWKLGANDRMLIEELQRGQAMAVLDMNALDAKTVETWVKTIRSAAEIGHTDTFAVPA